MTSDLPAPDGPRHAPRWRARAGLAACGLLLAVVGALAWSSFPPDPAQDLRAAN